MQLLRRMQLKLQPQSVSSHSPRVISRCCHFSRHVPMNVSLSEGMTPPGCTQIVIAIPPTSPQDRIRPGCPLRLKCPADTNPPTSIVASTLSRWPHEAPHRTCNTEAVCTIISMLISLYEQILATRASSRIQYGEQCPQENTLG